MNNNDTLNGITRHYPPYMSIEDDPLCVPFATLEDLFAIPFVHHWTKKMGFHQFSMSGNHLLAELKNGSEWWVVGTLQEPVPEIPVWAGRPSVTGKDGP